MALHQAVLLIWRMLNPALCLPYRTTRDQVHNAQQYDSADERDRQGGQIEHTIVDRDGVPGQYTEQPAADQRAEDADDDVEQRALARIGVHDDAGKPTN